MWAIGRASSTDEALSHRHQHLAAQMQMWTQLQARGLYAKRAPMESRWPVMNLAVGSGARDATLEEMVPQAGQPASHATGVCARECEVASTAAKADGAAQLR